MGKDSFRFDYDPAAALRNCGKLLGMELTQHGHQLEGGYYLTGEPHPYRKDKLKVYCQNGTIWVSEEGGRCISLTQWLIEFGGAEDYKAAIRMIKGENQAIHWNREFQKMAEAPVIRYVSSDVLTGCKQFDLRKCNLFNWMCKMFPEEKVREAWDIYNVTTDSHGNAVYWYVNQEGKILYDKRILYKPDGHRDKSFFPGRQFRVADGYSGRCYFGACIPDDGKKAFILESEKSVLLSYLYYGERRFLATGGKSNLREVDSNMLLCPDFDARDEWMDRGQVFAWWEKWGIDSIPVHSDIGDMIEWRMLHNKI